MVLKKPVCYADAVDPRNLAEMFAVSKVQARLPVKTQHAVEQAAGFQAMINSVLAELKGWSQVEKLSGRART